MKLRYLLIAFFVASCELCPAQVKIGDITITDSVAKEYFLWCYQHPDTTWFYEYSKSKIEEEKKEVERKKRLAKYKNGLDTTIWLSGNVFWGRAISGQEDYLSKNNIGRVYKDKQVNDDISESYIGYLTKHEPTAQDFGEWFIKKLK